MALSALGRALLLVSIAFGLLAVLWPSDLHLHLPAPLKDALIAAGCPLGYGADSGVPLPEDHPPVASEPSAEEVVPGVRVQVLAIYHNGTIWTANPKLPTAEALLVDEDSGSIARVGQLAALVAHAKEVEEGTVRRKVKVELRDLRGAFMMPGLVDPHVHLMPAGLMMSDVDLSTASSREDVTRALRHARQEACEGCWVLGGGWNEQRWGGALPDRAWLDEAVGVAPAFATRMDLHCGVASSEALRLAGIGPDTPDPAGGSIDRGPDGMPTGVLRDNAMQLITRLRGEPSLEARREALARAAQHALSRGVTTLGDMGRLANKDSAWNDFEEVYLPLADSRALPIRIHAYLPLKAWSRLAARVAADGYVHPSGRLFWGGVKEFADGSLGSSTALMRQPYLGCADKSEQEEGAASGDSSAGARECRDGEACCGIRLLELHEMRKLVEGADKAGLQVAIHAIGDRAVDNLARMFGKAAAARGARAAAEAAKFRPAGAPDTRPPSRPFRVEHAQHLSGPAAAAALAHPDMVVVANPQHLLDDALLAMAKLGGARADAPGHAFAYRTLADAGVALAFGSDWPVVGLEPLLGLHAAAFRGPPGERECCLASPVEASCLYSPDGGEEAAGASGPSPEPSLWPWLPDEALGLEAGLTAVTRGAATALMMQDYVGTLDEGLRADFVVLEHSPLRGPWRCRAPRVLATYLDGVCVHGCKEAPWAQA